MAIIFDFEAGKDFHFTAAFADHFGSKPAGDRVYLPAILGNGYIQEVYLDNGLSLCLHRYTLQQEFILRRHATGDGNVLTMKFTGREVEFGTSNFFTELHIPPEEEINFLVIVTTRQTLLHVLKLGQDGAAIEHTIRENPSFVLYEATTPEMERVLKQVALIDESTKLPALLYQTKAQELIHLLFTRLFFRRESASMAVDKEDVEKIYLIRSCILADLSSPPQLPELARNIGMSATKMKHLFRQVFGDSIYNYYQTARMQEAANLLRHHSVSHVGYSIGFTNLSHFTRMFEKHHRMKPKKYKDSAFH